MNRRASEISRIHKKNFCPYCGSPQERCYSIKTAAHLLDCSQQFFRNLIRDRKIGYVKIGRMVKIPSSELEKLVTFIPSLDEEASRALGYGSSNGAMFKKRKIGVRG